MRWLREEIGCNASKARKGRAREKVKPEVEKLAWAKASLRAEARLQGCRS